MDDHQAWGHLFGFGSTFQRQFASPGRYRYYCTPHPEMQGEVVVEP